jgi:hypothetical protein
MIKKILLYLSGPGVILYLGIILFIHLFIGKDMIVWMIPAFIVLFVVFIPLYAMEKFRQTDRRSRERDRTMQFSEKYRRTEWEGGNIHGKLPTHPERKKFMKKGK